MKARAWDDLGTLRAVVLIALEALENGDSQHALDILRASAEVMPSAK